MMLRRSVLVMLPLAACLLAASWRPANADGARLALKGYDPVAYFTEGKPTPGKAEFETAFDGARYRFASARNLELFKGEPDRYLPQFGGSCAMAMSNGVKIEAEPAHWLIVDGKLFLFAGMNGSDLMAARPVDVATSAREHWKKLEKVPF